MGKKLRMSTSNNLNGMNLTEEQILGINSAFFRINALGFLHWKELLHFRMSGGFQEEINSGSTKIYSDTFNKNLRSSFSNLGNHVQ